MVQSKAKTVQAYLDELPEGRRDIVSAVRDVILRHLPKGYHESISFGMISYEIPLERYPNTYNGQPLCYIGLAAQKNYFSLYLMCVYACAERERWLKKEFEKAGKKLDMGKSCVRFKKLEDLPLQVIGKVAAMATPEQFIERYESSRKSTGFKGSC